MHASHRIYSLLRFYSTSDKKLFGLASIGVHFLVVLQFSRNIDTT